MNPAPGIVMSPILTGAAPDVYIAISTGIVGILITMLALQEMMWLRRWEELICGVWVIAAPFALGYGGTLHLWHFVLGGVVVALALLELWQDRRRRFDS